MSHLAARHAALRSGLGAVPAGQDRFEDAVEMVTAMLPDRPVFCFQPETLAARARVFLEGFPGEVAYAVKANPSPAVIRTLAEAGVPVFDVASLEEIERVRALAPAAVLHYHNPVKSRTEIERAYREHGVRRFAVDCPEEIAKIAGIVGTDRTDRAGVEVAVRFRLAPAKASIHDFTSKFGASEDEAARLLADVAGLGFTAGLTFHPGSACVDPSAYVRHIEAAGRIATAAGVALQFLNVGGGFPVAYAELAAPTLDVFFAAIGETHARVFAGDTRPHLECEPGRGMVATSMSLVVRVKLVKQASGEVYLNDGIYGGLLEWSQARALRPAHRVIRVGGTVPSGDVAQFTVYGPTCDPLDVLPGGLVLPADIAEGDFVEFGPLGAYGAATATRFNGYGSAETIEVGQVLGA